MENEDGKIVIGTTIDNEEFYKKIRQLESSKDFEVKIKPELDAKQIKSEIYKAVEELNKFKNVEVLSSNDVDRIHGLITYIDAYNEKLKEISGQTIEIKGLTDAKDDLEDISKIDLENIKEKLDGIGDKVKKVTRSVGRWALAIFGVRGAYNLIRSAMSTIAGNDEQLKADIDYMKNALAYAIEPIVRAIVNLAKQLMFYIGYVVKAWTGKNIFENANKGLDKANRQAKELQKTTAGFDEMNIVGGGNQSQGGGTNLPSFDLSDMGNMKAPGWLEFIAKNGKLIVSILGGVAAALVAIKLGITGIKALGVGVLITGILYTIQSLIDYMNDPSWSNFGDVLTGIGIIVGGLALLFGSLPLAVSAAILLMIGLIVKFWDKIKEFLNNLVSNIYELGRKIKEWLQEHLGVLGGMIGVVVDTITGIIGGAIKFVTDLLDGLFRSVKDILDGIVQIFKGNFVEGIKSIFKGLINALITGLNAFIDAINLIVTPIRAIIVGIGWLLDKNWSMDDIKIPNIPYLAQGGIVNNPGKGVMMGSYVAGERGAEAVIPLNEETLDGLGSAFAKHTVINATIINEMNGRVISKELKQINAENNFAYNG